MSGPTPSSSSSSIPGPLLSKVLSQLTSDPDLPRPNPTQSFWQLPPHPLSDVQSPTLPPTATYAIIGSGITGASIASTLLNHPSFPADANIVVLEARTLTSGATGRNGGALTTPVGYDFLNLCREHGREEAVRIGLFANRTLNLLHEMGNASAEMRDVSEVRRLRGVIGFDDVETFERAKESFLAFDRDVPQANARVEVLTALEAKERFNLKNVVGAIVHSCGACWPYRLITTLWSTLLTTHKDRLVIETNTPVTSISYKPTSTSTHPYTLSTPRGPVSATTIFHATNGYTSHLLPSLRGQLFPFRGTMSVHHPPAGFGNHGATQAWSFVYPRRFVDGVLQGSLYYSHQNEKSGDVFLGGEKVGLGEIFVGDDSVVDPGSRGNIAGILPRLFERGWDGDGQWPGQGPVNGDKDGDWDGDGVANGTDGEADANGSVINGKREVEGEKGKPGVKAIWSGIMGFTGDHLPLVGRLPTSVSGRGPSASQSQTDPTSTETTNGTPNGLDTQNQPGSGTGEFIAAGFNGYGMANCWSAGEAVAKIALGHDDEADEFLPQSYRCTEERLGRLREIGARGALGRLFGV